MRRLIVNADDFGLTPGVNRAILEAHGHGVVTSATLMANGPAFDQAVQLAKTVPSLSVGCHVVLVDGSPLLTASQVQSLIPGRAQGEPRFRRALGRFAARAIAGRIDPAQVEAETIAQIRKLQAAGVAVTHLDTHKHTHLFSQVLQPLLRAAKACGVRAVRNPFEPVRLSLLAARPSLWKRWLEVRTLHALAGNFQRALGATGILASDGSIGIAATGSLDESLFRTLVDELPEGTWELVCHPGYNDAELQTLHTRLRQSRADELRLLTSAVTRARLAENGIQLISYRDLS
ncbi:MAG: ChbG/HpnK family deacetylase [Acidobacteriia bacterium]|nr:ChbG/HpnK family deacetylase [Terriglobia bacterium]